MVLKHRGEPSPLLADWRSQQHSISPATPLNTGHRTTPQVKLEPAPTSGPSDHLDTPAGSGYTTSNRDSNKYQSKPSIGDSETPRTTGAIVKPHQRDGQKAVSEVHVKVERLSFTPASSDTAVSNHPSHPSIARPVGLDHKRPKVTKTSQNRPVLATPRQPLSASHSCEQKSSGAKESENDSNNTSGSERIHTTTTMTKEIAPGSGEVSDQQSAAEAARRKRQEQQRLQKEKWQKKHGMAGQKKRTSDAAELSSGEGEGGGGGGGGAGRAFLDTDDLISAGRLKKIFVFNYTIF